VVTGRDLLSFALLSPGQEVILGRDEGVDFRLSDSNVSRRHASVRLLDDGRVLLRDLASTNGTRFLGHRIESATIELAQEFSVGSTVLRVEAFDQDQVLHLVRAQRKMAATEHRDPLTNLHLRDFLETRLPALLARALSEQSPMSCVFMDLDRFKRINDRFGHAVGDDVLRTVARLLVLGCRDNDHIVRYGGEEIAFFLSSNLWRSQDVALRIRADIKGYAWHHVHPDLRVTASFGVAEFEPGESVATWMDRADRAMYKAKRLGRDRVELADRGV
jgi:diguanylate cyclase (GGDEF)-like protein